MTGATKNNLRDSVVSVPGETSQGVGKLAGEYKCYFQNAKGTLYAGSDGLYFLGMMFFFERQISIRWVDVIKIIKGTSGLMIVVPDANHEFTDVPHLDRCWATLVALHSDALHRRGGTTTTSDPPMMISPSRPTLRRTNSDPLSEVRHNTENEPSGEEEQYMAAASLANLKEARDEVRISTMKRPAYHSFKVPKDRMIPLDESAESDIEEDLAVAWAQLQEPAGDEGYADVALKDHVLDCDIQKFYDLFIADSAPHSIAKFHEADGDSELTLTNWEPEEEGSPYFTRSFEYNHPVNAPLAPPMARAKKEQRIRRFADHGMCFETDTFVEDVPMADCFYVRDRVLVEPQSDNKIVVTAEFDIRFVKSTMFRSIIANTTRSEFIKYYKDYLAFVTEIVEGKPPPEKAEAKALPQPVVAPQAALPVSATQIMILLVVIVLFIQLWEMAQMQSMIRSLLALQQEMIETCPATSK